MDELIAALEQTGLPMAAYGWANKAPAEDYLVYGLDGQGDTYSPDGTVSEQALEGTVDLYAHSDDMEPFDAVQIALNSSHCAWRLNSIQYEQDTHLIHYEWVFQVVNSVG